MKDGKQLRLAEIITRIRLSVSTCWARPSSHVLLATNFPSVNVIELTLRSRGPGWRGVRLKEIRREGGPKRKSLGSANLPPDGGNANVAPVRRGTTVFLQKKQNQTKQ